MRGLPFKMDYNDITWFFRHYSRMTDKDIHIAEENGRRNGMAVAIFESAEDAQDAKMDLDKQYFQTNDSSRYIRLYSHKDHYMKQ